MPARLFHRLVCAVMAVCLLCACAQSAGVATAETAETAGRPTADARPTGIHTTAETATGETATGETVAGESAAAVPTVLPKTTDAGRSYLDNTLFIGDSNTARYMMYADDTGKAFTSVGNTIGVVSMGSGSITTLKCERFKGYKDAYTIPDAVAMLKPQRILIGFGTNDLAGYSAENFIKTYRKGLAAIAEAWEYADIIVCAVPPIDYQRENTNLTMKKVDAFNEALTAMCKEDGYHFLDTSETLKDASSGWAKKDYTLSDGVHLSKIAVSALFDYIRTHALTTADRRPKDLGKLPVPDGVPPGLIQKDPIAVRGAKVPVEFVATNGGRIQGYTSQNVKKGGTCATVTAVPDEGWVFDYWTASIGSVGSSASLTFTVPGNADANGVIITAHFAPGEHEHKYSEIEGTRIAPTCEQDGSAEYRCSICGDIIEKQLTRLGHAWDNGVVTQQPTTTAPGVRTFTCQRDSSHIRTESIPQLVPTATPTPTPTQAPPTPPPATPVPQSTPAPHVHNYQQTATSEATCTAGSTRTMTCSGCGDSYTEPTGDPLGHTGDVVVEEGNIRYHKCERCGAVLSQEEITVQQPDPPPPPPVEETPPTPTEGDPVEQSAE